MNGFHPALALLLNNNQRELMHFTNCNTLLLLSYLRVSVDDPWRSLVAEVHSKGELATLDCGWDVN